MKDTNVPVEKLQEEIQAIIWQVEKCGASPDLTKAVIMLGELRDSVMKSVPVEKWEEKLHEEWEDRVRGGHFVDNLYPFSPQSEVADDIEQWWMGKLSQALQAAVEEERKSLNDEIGRAVFDPIVDADYETKMPLLEKSGWNKAIRFALSIINKHQ